MIGLLYGYAICAFLIFALDLGGVIYAMRIGVLESDDSFDKDDWTTFALGVFHTALGHACVWPLTIVVVYVPQVKEIIESGRIPRITLTKRVAVPAQPEYTRQYQRLEALMVRALDEDSGTHPIVGVDMFVKQAWRQWKKELERQGFSKREFRSLFLQRFHAVQKLEDESEACAVAVVPDDATDEPPLKTELAKLMPEREIFRAICKKTWDLTGAHLNKEFGEDPAAHALPISHALQAMAWFQLRKECEERDVSIAWARNCFRATADHVCESESFDRMMDQRPASELSG